MREGERQTDRITISYLLTVITNKLDDIMLTNIIRAIEKQFVPRGKPTPLFTWLFCNIALGDFHLTSLSCVGRRQVSVEYRRVAEPG